MIKAPIKSIEFPSQSSDIWQDITKTNSIFEVPGNLNAILIFWLPKVGLDPCCVDILKELALLLC